MTHEDEDAAAAAAVADVDAATFTAVLTMLDGEGAQPALDRLQEILSQGKGQLAMLSLAGHAAHLLRMAAKARGQSVAELAVEYMEINAFSHLMADFADEDGDTGPASR